MSAWEEMQRKTALLQAELERSRQQAAEAEDRARSAEMRAQSAEAAVRNAEAHAEAANAEAARTQSVAAEEVQRAQSQAAAVTSQASEAVRLAQHEAAAVSAEARAAVLRAESQAAEAHARSASPEPTPPQGRQESLAPGPGAPQTTTGGERQASQMREHSPSRREASPTRREHSPAGSRKKKEATQIDEYGDVRPVQVGPKSTSHNAATDSTTRATQQREKRREDHLHRTRTAGADTVPTESARVAAEASTGTPDPEEVPPTAEAERQVQSDDPGFRGAVQH